MSTFRQDPKKILKKFSTHAIFSRKYDFFQIALAENFLRIFLWFTRGLLIKRRRLSYRLSNSVVWEPQKFKLIQKKSSLDLDKLSLLHILGAITLSPKKYD